MGSDHLCVPIATIWRVATSCLAHAPCMCPYLSSWLHAVPLHACLYLGACAVHATLSPVLSDGVRSLLAGHLSCSCLGGYWPVTLPTVHPCLRLLSQAESCPACAEVPIYLCSLCLACSLRVRWHFACACAFPAVQSGYWLHAFMQMLHCSCAACRFEVIASLAELWTARLEITTWPSCGLLCHSSPSIV